MQQSRRFPPNGCLWASYQTSFSLQVRRLSLVLISIVPQITAAFFALHFAFQIVPSMSVSREEEASQAGRAYTVAGNIDLFSCITVSRDRRGCLASQP
jgi:hypothetical protein